MSMPPEAAPPATPRKPPSAASRYLFVFLVGLVVGVIAVVMLMRTLEGRKTWQDRYPYATMQLMHAHASQFGAAVEANRCATTDTVPHLRSLRALANDLEPSFTDLRDDKRFVTHAGAMRAALDRAIASPPEGCAAAKAAMKPVGDTCGACHQDFRG